MNKQIRYYFPFYLVIQTALVFVLVMMPGFPDFFATLLMVISMQMMLRLRPNLGAVWIGLCAVLLVLVLFRNGNYRTQTTEVSSSIRISPGGVIMKVLPSPGPGLIRKMIIVLLSRRTGLLCDGSSV